MANDHMLGTCSLQGCFQLTTDAESVVWCEGLLTVHPVPHDAAGIPADQCFCLRFSVLIPTKGPVGHCTTDAASLMQQKVICQLVVKAQPFAFVS